MLKIDPVKKTLVRLNEVSLTEAEYKERYDLQEWIINSPDAFFAEFTEEKFFVVGSEIRPSEKVLDRIDVLAIDSQGNAVIIELKRDKNKLQLLQALTYAAMISQWDASKFREQVSDRCDALEQFLGYIDWSEINKKQRVILVAESYDWEVLATAEWLAESQALKIACCRISLVKDVNSAEYLSCMQIFPAIELEELVTRRGAEKAIMGAQQSLGTLLDSCKNSSVVDFFQKEIAANARMNASRTRLVYPQSGRMRWRMRLRQFGATVIQLGRFENDEELWNKNLSAPSLRVRGRGELGFRLQNAADLAFFRSEALSSDKFAWFSREESDEGESSEEDVSDQ